VTITDHTTGSTIYYTTNGTAPTAASTKYTGPIAVSSTETIEAIGVAAGLKNSVVSSATYTIGSGSTVATPTFSVAAGTYAAAQTVALADATTGAAIYYTTNGTAPTTASTKYTAPIAVSATETIEAIAVATGHANSGVGSAKYTVETPIRNEQHGADIEHSGDGAYRFLGAVAVSAKLTTLAAKTTYYFQVVVTTAGGSSSGSTLSFTTN